MDDQDRLIHALDRIKTTIIEVQEKFSEAAEIFNRKKAYDLTQMPNCQHVAEYIKYRKQNYCSDNEQTNEYDRLMTGGDNIKDFITHSQAKFLYALKIVNDNKEIVSSEEEAIKAQHELNEATLDIMEYNELLNRIYEVLKIPRGKG